MDDSQLVKAFQEGDEFAFVSLYNRYWEGVFSICAKMLLDPGLTIITDPIVEEPEPALISIHN